MIFAISYLFFTIVFPGFSEKTEKNLKHYSMKVIFLLVYGGNDVGKWKKELCKRLHYYIYYLILLSDSSRCSRS